MTIDEYIALYPAEVQEKLQAIRAEVRRLLPNAVERIAYGIPTFMLAKKNIFHFAAFKAHIGLYPGAAAIEAMAGELGAYKTSKGTIQVPLSESVPLALIDKLIAFNLNKFGLN